MKPPTDAPVEHYRALVAGDASRIVTITETEDGGWDVEVARWHMFPGRWEVAVVRLAPHEIRSVYDISVHGKGRTGQ